MVYKILLFLSVFLLISRSSPILNGKDVGSQLSFSENNIVVMGQNEFPFMAHLTIYGKKRLNEIIKPLTGRCGGVIISEDAILTAAHCIKDSIEVPKIYVRAGFVHSSLQAAETPGSWMKGYVKNEAFTEDYELTRDYKVYYMCDIAIIWLETPFKFGMNINKAKLVESSESIDNQLGFILGWGRNANGVRPDMLQKAHMRVISHNKCVRNHPKLLICLDMLCILSDTKTSSSCSGDSGGPFVIGNTVYGIVSFGARIVKNGQLICDPTKSEILSHVGMYIEWIQEKLQLGPQNVLNTPNEKRRNKEKPTNYGERKKTKSDNNDVFNDNQHSSSSQQCKCRRGKKSKNI